MCEMTLTQASEKACQLSSLLLVVSGSRDDALGSVDSENLVDLACDLAGAVAVCLLELSAVERQQVSEENKVTVNKNSSGGNHA